MNVDEVGSSSEWTREQDKAFENALATYPEDSSDRWEKIAADVPGKTLEEIKEHYKLLDDDINSIESGCVPLPPYNSSESSVSQAGDEGASKKGTSHSGHYNSEANHGSKNSKSDQERRKGIAWTEDEHRLFLLGLDKFGKGDWRSISWNFVVTRTPTQVLAVEAFQHPKVRLLVNQTVLQLEVLLENQPNSLPDILRHHPASLCTVFQL